MATVTGLTADRMLAIEAASVVDGDVNGAGHLILTTHGGTTMDAGSVIGPQGPPGTPAASGSVSPVANTLALRSSTAQVKTAPPSATDDAATKLYVDNTDGALHLYDQTFAGVLTLQGAGPYQLRIQTPTPADVDKIGMRVNNRAFFGVDNGKVVVGDSGSTHTIVFRVGPNATAADEQVSIDSTGKLTTKSLATTGDSAIGGNETVTGNVTAGGFVGPSALSATASQVGSLTSGTSGTATAVANNGVVFTAPASGRVLINMVPYMKTATAGIYCIAGIQVRTGNVIGSGTIVYTQQTACANANPEWALIGGVALATGLTPGAVYNTQALYRASTAGTSVSISATNWTVVPIL